MRRLSILPRRDVPHCGTVGIVKHGRDENGQQRFRCRLPLGCGRTFNALTNTPLARMRKPRGLAGLCRGTRRAAVTRLGS